MSLNISGSLLYAQFPLSGQSSIRTSQFDNAPRIFNRQNGISSGQDSIESLLPILLNSILSILEQTLGQQGGPISRPPLPRPVISGEQGPFDKSLPGGFGANAAVNYQRLADRNPELANRADIQYTPANAPKFADAIGYAKKDIERFDGNRDGKLDRQEIARIFDGDTQKAQKYLRALDTSGDGFLDVKEDAASVLIQDAPELVEKTSTNPFGSAGNADGKITAQERERFERAVESNPDLVRQVSRQLQQQDNLDGKLREVQQGNRQLYPNGGTGSSGLLDRLKRLIQLLLSRL